MSEEQSINSESEESEIAQLLQYVQLDPDGLKNILLENLDESESKDQFRDLLFSFLCDSEDFKTIMESFNSIPELKKAVCAKKMGSS